MPDAARPARIRQALLRVRTGLAARNRPAGYGNQFGGGHLSGNHPLARAVLRRRTHDLGLSAQRHAAAARRFRPPHAVARGAAEAHSSEARPRQYYEHVERRHVSGLNRAENSPRPVAPNGSAGALPDPRDRSRAAFGCPPIFTRLTVSGMLFAETDNASGRKTCDSGNVLCRRAKAETKNRGTGGTRLIGKRTDRFHKADPRQQAAARLPTGCGLYGSFRPLQHLQRLGQQLPELVRPKRSPDVSSGE